MANSKMSQILRSALKRKQAARAGYSLRALARDLEVSAAFVCNIMSGKRHLPKERLKDFCHFLELEVLEREELIKSVVLDGFSLRILSQRHRPEQKLKTRKSADTIDGGFLSSWVHIAILEGLTLSPPHNDPDELRARLGLTIGQFNDSLKILLKAGMITESKGRFKKREEHLYVVAGRSKKEIRAFHEMMILKAREELTTKTSSEDFQRRLINGFTIAVNAEASEGDCTDVYQYNLQFFPLTKKL